jgi:hypothetical protein
VFRFFERIASASSTTMSWQATRRKEAVDETAAELAAARWLS